MTDKELKRLGRSELIEILYELQKRNDDLMQENRQLKEALDDRQLHLSEAGSIAEAALRVNGVFEAAQAAADQYLQSIRSANADMETKIAEARQKADAIIRVAEEKAQQTAAEADRQAEASWAAFRQKADELIRAHEELSALAEKGRAQQ